MALRPPKIRAKARDVNWTHTQCEGPVGEGDARAVLGYARVWTHTQCEGPVAEVTHTQC